MSTPQRNGKLTYVRLSEVPDVTAEVAKDLEISHEAAADLVRAHGYLKTAAAIVAKVRAGQAKRMRLDSAAWRAEAAGRILGGEEEGE